MKFLSTPSARRATGAGHHEKTAHTEFLSTPSARRATEGPRGGHGGLHISIHALREEGDPVVFDVGLCILISIHALREEGDTPMMLCIVGIRNYFYPRPPRGGRRSAAVEARDCRIFLSTPSARRATRGNKYPCRHHKISIHALREEGDRCARRFCFPAVQFLSTPSARRATSLPGRLISSMSYFYPRPPRGGRRAAPISLIMALVFLSTPSARRATRVDLKGGGRMCISIHALREEGDVSDRRIFTPSNLFLSTPSARRATLMSRPSFRCQV